MLSVIVGVLIYLGLLIIGIQLRAPARRLHRNRGNHPDIRLPDGGNGAGRRRLLAKAALRSALIVVGLYVMVNQFETNLIYPLIVKKVVGIPPLLVIVALIAGGNSPASSASSSPCRSRPWSSSSSPTSTSASAAPRARSKWPAYLTTTLPYVNADPHIGLRLNSCRRMSSRAPAARGEEVFFNTGTDEHGQKILARPRRRRGRTCRPMSTTMRASSRSSRTALDLSYDAFIRTTDPTTYAAAQELWRRCDAAGDIYKKSYTGVYCVGCEAYKTENELDRERQMHAPPHPRAGSSSTEENYFFKFSKYRANGCSHTSRSPDFVVPEWRRQEAIDFVKAGLEDFSISREKARFRGESRCPATIPR